jgi:hypothetical protein
MEALEGMELKAYHVIVSEDFEQLVKDTVNEMGGRLRPKVRARTELMLKEFEDLSESTEMTTTLEEGADIFGRDANPAEWLYTRTFLCCVPRPHDAQTVVQSSGGATASRRIMNPRQQDPDAQTRDFSLNRSTPSS